MTTIDKSIALLLFDERRKADPFADFVIADDFSAPNGTALPDHTPDKAPAGSSWAEILGSKWDINNNRVDGGGADGDEVEIESGIANLYVEAVVQRGGGDAPGVILRYKDSTRYWLMQLNYISTQLQLYLKDGGFVSKRTVSVGALDNNTDYTIRLQAGADNVLHMFLDSTEYASVSDATFSTSTGVGFRSANSQFDNFRVAAVA